MSSVKRRPFCFVLNVLTPFWCWIFWEIITIHLCLLSFINTNMAQLVEILPHGNKDQLTIHSQYHGCSCLINAMYGPCSPRTVFHAAILKNRCRIIVISILMASSKTAVLTHWSYCILVLSRWFILSNTLWHLTHCHWILMKSMLLFNEEFEQ